MRNLYKNVTGLLTKKFIHLLKRAEDGILDLNKAAETLQVRFLYKWFWPIYLLPFLFVSYMNLNSPVL